MTTPGRERRSAEGAASADAAALAHALAPGTLAAWLQGRRWFAAKGERLERVTVHDAIPVTAPGLRAAVVRVDVAIAGGRVERYQVPLAVMEQPPADAAPLAEVHGEGWRGALVDAVLHPEFHRLLARGLAAGAAYTGPSGARWVLEPERGASLDDLAEQPVAVGRAEQSNTSLRFGDRAILKLFRRLEGGEHPDVEMTRFLTVVAGFPHVPRLLATARVEDEGGATVAAMLQALVPGAEDGWDVALASARDFLRRGDPEARVAFAAEARALGEMTRRLHAALASGHGDPAFAPVVASGDDVAEWAGAARRMLLEATDLLAARRREGALPAAVVPVADAVTRRRGELLADVDVLAAAVGHAPGERLRHHGDYHLGQVLRGADGRWYAIDFEGEPRRSLAERRARQSVLRDVAGMLRSFAYAALVAAHDVGGLGADATVERGVARWERAVRDAFLDAYFAAGPAVFLPDADAARHDLLTLFEMEKVFYELAYELQHRPDWTWVPLRGIGRLLGAGRGRR